MTVLVFRNYVFPAFYLERKQMNQKPRLGPGGGWVGEVLGLIFTGYVPLASQSPYPIIVYSVRQICYFRDPSLVTRYFYELTHFLD